MFLDDPYWFSLQVGPGTDALMDFLIVSSGPKDPLRVGRYDYAMAAPPMDGVPGLSVNLMDGIGCVNARGRFEIHTLEWTPVTSSSRTPHLHRFLATFEQQCTEYEIRGCLNFAP